jgi:X-X-X-Leu-X-X-Gly heptad repeat protein
MTSRTIRALWSLLLTVPIIVGAVFAFSSSWEPSQAWSSADDTTGAPADQVSAEDIVNARRAAGEAQSQAGFLVSGAEQLADGTTELREGADELGPGVDQLVEGAQALTNGMTELQAGTGQLGDGATELANAVDAAVGQVVGLGAMQGQLLKAVESAEDDLKGVKGKEAKEIRSAIADIKSQLEGFDVDAEVTDPLNELQQGSRELSNQLDVPGYAYHDGIYSATEGSKQLLAGLQELQSGTGALTGGSQELADGADRVKSMADLNKTKADAVQRALPAVQAPAAGSGTEEVDPELAAAEEDTTGALSPVVAMLLAALVMLGGAALGWLGINRIGRPVITLVVGTLGLVVAGTMLLWILASSITPLGVFIGAGLMALASLASTVITRAVLARMSTTPGIITTAIAGIVQLGIVGYVWKTATTGEIGTVWQVLANLTPLNWATTGLIAAGNDGSTTMLWTSAVVLAAIVILGFIVVGLNRRPHQQFADSLDDDAADDSDYEESAVSTA